MDNDCTNQATLHKLKKAMEQQSRCHRLYRSDTVGCSPIHAKQEPSSTKSLIKTPVGSLAAYGTNPVHSPVIKGLLEGQKNEYSEALEKIECLKKSAGYHNPGDSLAKTPQKKDETEEYKKQILEMGKEIRELKRQHLKNRQKFECEKEEIIRTHEVTVQNMQDQFNKETADKKGEADERLTKIKNELEEVKEEIKDLVKSKEKLKALKDQYVEAELAAETEINSLKIELEELHKISGEEIKSEIEPSLSESNEIENDPDLDESKVLEESSIEIKSIHCTKGRASLTDQTPVILDRIEVLVKKMKY